TMGLGTILSARAVILLATGEAKAAAVRAALTGPVTTDCPASLLRHHADVAWHLDADAAWSVAASSSSGAWPSSATSC
ncbi:6-phosphogluconolactonase, partial [Mycobacterium tuberculosis]|nr:6-phosphogluconolactonase [Mycobacterium tuberculosis]